MDGWKRIGISVKKAAGSQALIELKKQFCDQRKCLECEIGKELLQPAEIRNFLKVALSTASLPVIIYLHINIRMNTIHHRTGIGRPLKNGFIFFRYM